MNGCSTCGIMSGVRRKDKGRNPKIKYLIKEA
jgi:hypothetical protein